MGGYQPDKVIKAVLRDCTEDLVTSELPVPPVSTYLNINGHFTDEESARCHAEDASDEQKMQIFIEILNTKCDEVLDCLIEYLEKKNQMHPHLTRVLLAARDRRRINPDDEEEGEEDDLDPGDFWLTADGVEIIRNLIMTSPTAKGKWLEICLHIIKTPAHLEKVKSVNAGRPEKMIDTSLEYWIGGTETDFKPSYDTLVKILESRKMKKQAEALLKIKTKLFRACHPGKELPTSA